MGLAPEVRGTTLKGSRIRIRVLTCRSPSAGVGRGGALGHAAGGSPMVWLSSLRLEHHTLRVSRLLQRPGGRADRVSRARLSKGAGQRMAPKMQVMSRIGFLYPSGRSRPRPWPPNDLLSISVLAPTGWAVDSNGTGSTAHRAAHPYRMDGGGHPADPRHRVARQRLHGQRAGRLGRRRLIPPSGQSQTLVESRVLRRATSRLTAQPEARQESRRGC
jgi:hypothetical protein